MKEILLRAACALLVVAPGPLRAQCECKFTVPSGFTLIAVGCNDGTRTLHDLLAEPGVPGTKFTYVEPATGRFVETTWLGPDLGWEGEPVRLPPGSGVYVFNPAATEQALRFSGPPPAAGFSPPPGPRPAIYGLRECGRESANPYRDIFGAPPGEGTLAAVLVRTGPGPLEAQLVRYRYAGGAWGPDPEWDIMLPFAVPLSPRLAAHQGIFFFCQECPPPLLPPEPKAPAPPPAACALLQCFDFNGTNLPARFDAPPSCTVVPNDVRLESGRPGPTGLAGDGHLRLVAAGPGFFSTTNLNGNWLCHATNGCVQLCFDFLVISNRTAPIEPRVLLLNRVDPCGLPRLAAVWEPAGPGQVFADGWRRQGLPIAPRDAAGRLPANAQGGWRMLGGAADSDWEVLLAGVQQVVFTSNAREAHVLGFDNLCLGVTNCPPPCLRLTAETVTCATNQGAYHWSFELINDTPGPAGYLGALDLPPGMRVNGSADGALVRLDPPLAAGGRRRLGLFVQSTNPPGPLCVRLTLHDPSLALCCEQAHCVTLPECCALLTATRLSCPTNAPGELEWRFTYHNLTAETVRYLFVVPRGDTLSCLTVPEPVIRLDPPVPPGGAADLAVRLRMRPDCPDRICLIVAGHTEDFRECCAVEACLTLPPCLPRTRHLVLAAGPESPAGFLRLSWAGDLVLECAESPSGPWTALPHAASPLEWPADGASRFFRVREP